MNLDGIEKITQPTLSDLVEGKIRAFILEAGLVPGDKLPSELEFAEKLGVSRNIVREALSRLRMLGVAESKKRRGLILTEPDIFRGLQTVLELPVLSETKKSELFQLRIFLEMGMASQVFRNKTPELIESLEEIVQYEEKSLEEKNTKKRVYSDIEFHTHLYEATGNATLKHFQALLKPFITKNTNIFFSDPHKVEDITTHREMLETLKSGTEAEFIDIMRTHLSHFLN